MENEMNLSNLQQRKRDLEHDVDRLAAVVTSIERKLSGGSLAVTAADLAARQGELSQARVALATINQGVVAKRV